MGKRWQDFEEILEIGEGRKKNVGVNLPLIEPDDGAGCATSTLVKPPVPQDMVRC